MNLELAIREAIFETERKDWEKMQEPENLYKAFQYHSSVQERDQYRSVIK